MEKRTNGKILGDSFRRLLYLSSLKNLTREDRYEMKVRCKILDIYFFNKKYSDYDKKYCVGKLSEIDNMSAERKTQLARNYRGMEG